MMKSSRIKQAKFHCIVLSKQANTVSDLCRLKPDPPGHRKRVTTGKEGDSGSNRIIQSIEFQGEITWTTGAFDDLRTTIQCSFVARPGQVSGYPTSSLVVKRPVAGRLWHSRPRQSIIGVTPRLYFNSVIATVSVRVSLVGIRSMDFHFDSISETIAVTVYIQGVTTGIALADENSRISLHSINQSITIGILIIRVRPGQNLIQIR